jgi:hypothetical protein
VEVEVPQPSEFRGSFWLAASPEDSRPGRLAVSADGRASVELTPELYPAFELRWSR